MTLTVSEDSIMEVAVQQRAATPFNDINNSDAPWIWPAWNQAYYQEPGSFLTTQGEIIQTAQNFHRTSKDFPKVPRISCGRFQDVERPQDVLWRSMLSGNNLIDIDTMSMMPNLRLIEDSICYFSLIQTCNNSGLHFTVK